MNTQIRDPFTYLKNIVADTVHSCIRELDVNAAKICSKDLVRTFIEIPPREEFGDLALPIPRIYKICKLSDGRLIDCIIRRLSSLDLIKSCEKVSAYINMRVNEIAYGKLVSSLLRLLRDDYGFVRVSKPLRIVVEFVSANPIHPLHIGSGRNAALGNFIANILEAVGHIVERRYYIDDLGLQVAHLAYGYKLLGKPKPPKNMKVDHFLGIIYAATSILVEIKDLKEKAERAKAEGNYEEYSKIMAEISRLIADLQSLRDKGDYVSKLIDKLIDEVMKRDNPKTEINELMRKYELGDEDTSNLVKEVTSLVMEGIKETLKLIEVKMDVWDWESDLIREGLVKKVLDQASRSPYFTIHKGAPALDFKELLKSNEIKDKLRIPRGLEIPPLILARSDGTTLYTTRDIAYTIKKFREFNADKVINVIAIEQTLAQAQLRLALYALGFKREAENLIHYAYEMVNLPGISMSSRRGRYVTIDDLIHNLKLRVLNLMKKRGSNVSEEVALKIARSAFKYMMLSTSPNKTITFDVEKALDINRNSAPYIQYTYARARSILNKYGKPIDWDNIDYSSLSIGLRRKLLMLIGKFPSVITYVANELHPEDLITYLNEVADTFNSWYDSESVLGEKNPKVRNAKLMLTYGVMIILKNSMKILGLDVLPRI